MNSDPALRAVLNDLKQIRAWCTRNQGQPVPRKAIEYIAENADVLAFFVSALYDGTTQAQRAALHTANPATLDASVIDDGVRGVVESGIKECIEVVGGNSLAHVEEDDIVMLLRAMQYVEHIEGRHSPIAVAMTPLSLP